MKNNMKPIHFTVIELKEDYGYEIRARTVRIYGYRIGLHNFAAVSKPFLSARLVTDREQWANMHRQWNISQCGKLAFSNEPTFTVKPISLHKPAWRKVEERYKLSNWFPLLSLDTESIFYGLHFL